MSKKNHKPAAKGQDFEYVEEYDFSDEEFMDDVMDVDGFMAHAAETLKSAQSTALELTRLALQYAKNVDEDKVFELFRRAAEEINEIYG
ncbi:hypothetical protein Lbir_1654 [Legionella birminghamensis]|uniref:Uncharacterized protein n=1 Tax=Legionella birminghamensis TaxID=28083 RepID=A0A378I847_9GAMM|nr:hypothetical protein [Legionella birminghamensis]KTC71502.1 hypothetical protein Lbir_1654 [Legionella birminghamensis]STX30890.1 Uncharacterised protein [Legionella birminghamensis]